eukprot:gb/GECH01002901.1/.p1 GENE.gb/GECH01002901.1/~~gb/GECH01002901.1/.p1  ORF type:complete len:133 (+),score=19.39 gb/GECH01002901.1/:1-399(+)
MPRASSSSSKTPNPPSKDSTAPSIITVFSELTSTYNQRTPRRIKILDAFLVYTAAIAALQLAYGTMVGTFPFNSFLSGFLGAVAMFTLTACLRTQVNPSNKDEFSHRPAERVFADYVLCVVAMLLVVFSFMG